MVRVSTRQDHGDEAPWEVTATLTEVGDEADWDESGVVESSGRWELAVIPGSPPDPLYADGDFLYIWVPGV